MAHSAELLINLLIFAKWLASKQIQHVLLLLMCLDNKKLWKQSWQQIHGCTPEPKKSNFILVLSSFAVWDPAQADLV